MYRTLPHAQRRYDRGATIVEASLVTVLFCIFLLFVVDAGRYFYTYAIFLWGAHEAVDAATKLPMELNTTAAACAAPPQGQTLTDCQRYQEAVEKVIAIAEKRARMVASTAPDAFVRLKTFDLYTASDYATQQSGLTPITGSLVQFNRPGELVRRNELSGSVTSINHPTRTFGTLQGEGWPKTGENWSDILGDHPMEVVLEAEMKPITPFLPSLTIRARQMGFRRTGNRSKTVPQDVDLCPFHPELNPGQCGCGVAAVDTDGDATADCRDRCPNDAIKIDPGACGCSVPDLDGNNNGVPDCNECSIDSDNDGTPDCTDTCPGLGEDPWNNDDDDGDGTTNCFDKCPWNPQKVSNAGPCGCSGIKSSPGICGCGVEDTAQNTEDTDGDGAVRCNDGCPTDPNKTNPLQCGCGAPEGSDSDGDGIRDCLDTCPFRPEDPWNNDDDDADGTNNCEDQCPWNPDKTSSAGACGCTGTLPDPGPCGCSAPSGQGAEDTDGDGTINCFDGCPTDPNKTNPLQCGCGAPEGADSDGDGIRDCRDTCPFRPEDLWNDDDDDADGTTNCTDQCPWNPNKTVDSGSCGCTGILVNSGVCGCFVVDDPASTTADPDGDGTPNCQDGCPTDPVKIDPLQCGCGMPEGADSDGDGIRDCRDTCPFRPEDPWNNDDDDADGIDNCNDQCPWNPNKTTPGSCGCNAVNTEPGVCGCNIQPNASNTGDSDGDGTINCQDACPVDPNKTAPLVCGCNVAEDTGDADNDGVPNCRDNPDCQPCLSQQAACEAAKAQCYADCATAANREECDGICYQTYRECDACCRVPACAFGCIAGGG